MGLCIYLNYIYSAATSLGPRGSWKGINPWLCVSWQGLLLCYMYLLRSSDDVADDVYSGLPLRMSLYVKFWHNFPITLVLQKKPWSVVILWQQSLESSKRERQLHFQDGTIFPLDASSLPGVMSANGDTSIVMKGITHGACDYLIKPVRMEELRNIWQHVVRKKGIESPKLGSCSNTESTSSSELLENSKKRKEVSFMGQGLVEDSSILKRARMNWTVNLHQRFVNAVNQLGVEKAVPKKLLDVMNVEGLTRGNVASHLQKYRLYLKRLSGAKLERRHPIASVQASDGGKSGGSMRMMPGGRSPCSLPSIEGLNLRTGITESSVCAKNVGPAMERSLTSTLEASQEKQQRSADRAQALPGALGFVDSCPVQAAAPESSFDLESYLQVPQSHLLSSWSMPSSLGGFTHSGPQPLKLEDEMGAGPHGVQGEGVVSHLLASRSMPSSLGVFAHSGKPPKLENEMVGARPQDARVEGFVSYWNINPVGEGHGLGKHTPVDVQMQGSYANLEGNRACSEGTQAAGRCVEIPDDKNLSGEMSSCAVPTTEMNREINMDVLDWWQIPEQQLSVSDYLLDEEGSL